MPAILMDTNIVGHYFDGLAYSAEYFMPAGVWGCPPTINKILLIFEEGVWGNQGFPHYGGLGAEPPTPNKREGAALQAAGLKAPPAWEESSPAGLLAQPTGRSPWGLPGLRANKKKKKANNRPGAW